MMKIQSTIILLLIFQSLWAGGEADDVQLLLNSNKSYLIESTFMAVDSLLAEKNEKKSVIRAAFYSAVIPGSGQYYAGSLWKSLLFAGLEITGWTVYALYTSKGNNKETEMMNFADQHWIEKKYWSKLYYDAKRRGDIPNLPDYPVDAENILLEYNAEVVNSLRYLEVELGHTHRLPETKTQQYYEMIYKYLTQFGNGWQDANFYEVYYGNTDKMTPQMFTYRDMRNDMNGFFNVATTSVNLILVNHVLSALDAAWTTKNYNRHLEMRIRAYNKKYYGENVQMYGINLSW